MNPYHNLTDDQLAEWHQQDTRIAQLKRDLAESRKATEAVQQYAEDEYAKLRSELLNRADTIIDLTGKLHNQTNAARANAAALVTVLAALESLLKAFRHPGVLKSGHWWNGEVFDAIKGAEQVLETHGIPF